MRFSEFRF